MRARIAVLTCMVLIGVTVATISSSIAAETSSTTKTEKGGDKNDQMDILKFLSTIIVALPWPIVVVIVASKFESEIKAVLSRINKLKGFGLDADLGEALQEAEKENLPILQRSSSPLDESPPPGVPDEKTIAQLLEIFPASVIPLKWKQLEEEVSQLYELAVSPMSSRPTFTQIQNSIPQQFRSLFRHLRTIRNSAIEQGGQVSALQAKEFIQLTDRLIAALRAGR